MNNPFYYIPSGLCDVALASVLDDIKCHPEWVDEVKGGKTFGVLAVKDDKGNISFLKAYSGQMLGSYDWEGYVPAVFDYLDENGYFKTHEAEIVSVNKEIERASQLDELRIARDALYAVEQQKPQLPPSRPMPEDEEGRAGYIRQRQFEKGEHRRQKAVWNALVTEKRQRLQSLQDEISALKTKRKLMSDALQRWLFEQFEMLNAMGERKNLIDIFADWAERTGSKCVVPPSGSGECCAPKLLQYAFKNNFTPVEIVEFNGKGEILGACQSRCAPILDWMLRGVVTDENPLHSQENRSSLTVLYEDDDIIVVDKPEGMLSVPGKSTRRSAWDILKEMRPGCPDLLMVHRLDMQTSGVLMAAKNTAAYKDMQRRFAMGEIHKTYYALLEGVLDLPVGHTGIIDLPLSADYLNRPRQKVDYENGKPSVTHYEVMGERDGHTLLKLQPVTGRTHQLRVHCAHPDGLGMPILGDDLYGKHAERLYLHAEILHFPLSIFHFPFKKDLTSFRISAPCPFPTQA